MLQSERVNVYTHLAGAIAMVPGTIFLILRQAGAASIGGMIAVIVYGASAIALFSFSALYHSTKKAENEKSITRTLDHIGIYFLIAGTYTPICVNALGPGWGTGILVTQWTLAGLGVITSLFLLGAPRWISVVVYVVMGWVAIIAIQPIYRAVGPQTLLALAGGGITYTAGALIYVFKKPNPWPGVVGFHEIWHFFILVAAGLHYYMIWTVVP